MNRTNTAGSSRTLNGCAGRRHKACGYKLSFNHSPFSVLRSSVFRVSGTLFRNAGLTSWLLAPVFFLSACASPRVVEVTSRTRLKDIDVADERVFVADPASHIRYRPRDLPANKQREEFYVHWLGAAVDRVKFEYRQVDVPDTVKEQSFTSAGPRWHVFEVRGEEFHAGGLVSAWRVSLWSGDQLLAERKSALW